MPQVLVHGGRRWSHRPQQPVTAPRHPAGHPPAGHRHLARPRLLVAGHQTSIATTGAYQPALPEGLASPRRAECPDPHGLRGHRSRVSRSCISAGTRAPHVGPAATVRDGSLGAASAGQRGHGEHPGARVSVAETLIGRGQRTHGGQQGWPKTGTITMKAGHMAANNRRPCQPRPLKNGHTGPHPAVGLAFVAS